MGLPQLKASPFLYLPAHKKAPGRVPYLYIYLPVCKSVRKVLIMSYEDHGPLTL